MENEEVLAKGNYERIGQYNSFLTHKVNGEKHNFEKPASNHEKAIKFVLDRLLSKQYGVIKSVDEIDGIGHRIVHGGEKFTKPVIINDEVIKEIEKRSEYPESFEKYNSKKKRKNTYYRIYVKNYTIFYTIKDNAMEVRRILSSRRNFDKLI